MQQGTKYSKYHTSKIKKPSYEWLVERYRNISHYNKLLKYFTNFSEENNNFCDQWNLNANVFYNKSDYMNYLFPIFLQVSTKFSNIWSTSVTEISYVWGVSFYTKFHTTLIMFHCFVQPLCLQYISNTIRRIIFACLSMHDFTLTFL